ncbi:MAG: NAD(P)-dependent oxidoreductase [Mucilaginibacter polytrichastri]|nr:NAD(P)-dependent oxidoreductase [Mucilaginibacter polytrichastri]
MKIALIGATGFVGSAVLKEASERGHEVTALVRNPEKITTENSNVHAVAVDIFDTDTLAERLRGHDIVISAYNPGWTNPNYTSDFGKGSASVESATEKSGVKRLLVVGGGGSLFVAPGVQAVDTPEFPEEYRSPAKAARDYLNVIRGNTTLDWTFLSPAFELTPGERTGTYRTGLENPVFDENGRSRISVEDLAVAIVDEAENPKHLRARFTASY